MPYRHGTAVLLRPIHLDAPLASLQLAEYMFAIEHGALNDVHLFHKEERALRHHPLLHGLADLFIEFACEYSVILNHVDDYVSLVREA